MAERWRVHTVHSLLMVVTGLEQCAVDGLLVPASSPEVAVAAGTTSHRPRSAQHKVFRAQFFLTSSNRRAAPLA
jgi:hypothetical protein